MVHFISEGKINNWIWWRDLKNEMKELACITICHRAALHNENLVSLWDSSLSQVNVKTCSESQCCSSYPARIRIKDELLFLQKIINFTNKLYLFSLESNVRKNMYHVFFSVWHSESQKSTDYIVVIRPEDYFS